MEPQEYRPAHRKTGRRFYLIFETINTVSFALLAGNIVVLLLLRFGANNFLLGLVQAFPYVSFLFIPLAKALIPRYGLVQTFARAWTFRYLVMIPLASAPLFALGGNIALGTGLVVGGFLLFHVLRGFGLVSITPLVQALSVGGDRGAFIAQKNILVYGSSLLTGLLISFGLGSTAPLERYSLFLASGVAMGLLASSFIYRIPEPPGGKDAARAPFLPDILHALKDPTFQRFLVPYAIYMFVGGLGRSFLVVYAKRGFGLSDDLALLIMVVAGLGAVVMGYVSKIALDRLGSKPLFIIFNMVYTLSVLPIVFLDTTAFSRPLLFLAILGFFANLGGAGGETASQAYFFNINKGERQFNVGMLYFLVMGISGSIGSLSGGAFLQLLGDIPGLGTSGVWQWYYGVVAVLGLITSLFLTRLVPLGAKSVATTLGAIINPRKIETMRLLQKLNQSQTLGEELSTLRKLHRVSTHLAAADLVKRLDSPFLAVRSSVLTALGKLSRHPMVEDALIRQVEEERFGTAATAARILGEGGHQAAVPALMKALSSDDNNLRIRSLEALGRLGHQGAVPEVEDLIRHTTDPLLIAWGIGALRRLADARSMPVLLEVLERIQPEPFMRDEVVYGMSGLLGIDGWLYPRYTAFLADPRQGLALLRDDIETLGLDGNLVQGQLERLADLVVVDDPAAMGLVWAQAAGEALTTAQELGYVEPALVRRILESCASNEVQGFVRFRFFLASWLIHEFMVRVMPTGTGGGFLATPS